MRTGQSRTRASHKKDTANIKRTARESNFFKQQRRMTTSTTNSTKSTVKDEDKKDGKDNNFPALDKKDIAPSPGKCPVNIRPRWTHNPILLSMLACSNMHDCEEAKEIYRQCQANMSDSMICEAAEKYYKMCHENGSIFTDIPYHEE